MKSRKGYLTAPNDYSDSIIGHWILDEVLTDGVTQYAKDSGPRKIHLYSDTTLSAGFSDTAGRGTFNGTTDYFKHIHKYMEQISALNGTGGSLPSLLFSFNVNGAAQSNVGILGNRGANGATTAGCDVIALATGAVGLNWKNAAGTANTTTTATSTTLLDSSDKQVIVLLDRTNGKLKSWVNGVADVDVNHSATYNTPAPTDTATNPGLTIGARGTGDVNYFAGQLWNLQLYRTWLAVPVDPSAWVTKLFAGNYLTKSDL